MTSRARWLMIPALVGLILGTLREQSVLSLLSLSLLLWLAAEWFLFWWRVRFGLPRLILERTVNGRTGNGGILWVGRPNTVRVEVRARSGRLSPLLLIRDVLPENLELIARSDSDVPPGRDLKSPLGQEKDAVSVANDPREANQPANQLILVVSSRECAFTYRVRARAAGRVSFPGLTVILQDAHGFFRAERFVPVPQTFRVLPGYADAGKSRPLVKRINALSQHGIHRLQRSGMGSELLELREYVVGDPPKSIAWKVSARRDKLMTRQYESEVPVRVQLFLDGSFGTRVGGFGRRLLDQMTFAAASITRAATLSGDPVGAILFDERGQRRIPFSSGERGFYAILEALADFCDRIAPPPHALTAELHNAAISICGERFPELLEERINQVPFTIFPLLPWNRRRFHERCRLANVMASIYRLSPTKQVQLIYDDSLMAVCLQHFLSRSGLSWMAPIVAPRGRSLQDGLPRMKLLSEALTLAVARARDNEVFVVMADLLDCAPGISHLMPAVRTALARHHRVAFVCPSPNFLRPTVESTQPASMSVDDLLLAADQIRSRELGLRLKRELTRVGASVAFSGEQNAIRIVLSEMEIARTGRSAPAGVRR